MTQTFPAYGVDKHRRQIRHLPKLAPISLAVWTMFSTAVLADESAEKSLPRIEVVGQGTESISRLPGSVSLVTNETILINQPLSTQDAIKFVPGVVVREEEGYGFIPNIGMRGLDPNRSQKLLVLEDGVPMRPKSKDLTWRCSWTDSADELFNLIEGSLYSNEYDSVISSHCKSRKGFEEAVNTTGLSEFLQ